MASPTPYATNAHKVLTKPIDFDAPGAPTSQTFHGVSVIVDGHIIGRIQSWSPQMYSRQGEWIYELNHLTFGRPVDYIPGINENYTINCSRVEVWGQELERALGYPSVWADLIDQDRPFTVKEFLFRGSVPYRSWTYTGCWFRNKNMNEFQAKDIPQIMVNAELAFVSRINA